MKPTPETDDATLIANDIEHGGNFNAVHVQVSKRLERERDEARAEIAAIKAMLLDPVEVELDMIRGNIAIPARPEFGGVYDTGKAMANLIRDRDEARGQRDRLAADLRIIADGTSCRECGGEDQALLAREALQSLTPNESISNQ